MGRMAAICQLVQSLLVFPIVGPWMFAGALTMSKGKKLLWWGSAATIQVIKCLLTYADLLGGQTYSGIMLSILNLLLLPLLILCFEEPFSELVIYMMLAAMGQAALMMPVQLIFGPMLAAATTLGRCLAVEVVFTVTEVVSVWIVILWLRKAKQYVPNWPRPIHVLTVVVSVGALVGSVLFYGVLTPAEQISGSNVSGTLTVLLFVTAAVLVFWAIFNMADRRRLQLELDAASMQRELQYQALKQQMHSMDELHLFQHDVQNNYLVMQGCLERGEVDAVRTMLADLTRRAAKTGVRYSKNPVADAILVDAADRCHEEGIDFTVAGALPHKELQSPVDFAPLLQNLLNNAREAAAKAEPPRYVHVQFSAQADHLCITVTNSSVETLPAKGGTTKPDKERHGFGLRIIQQVVDKYDGLFELTQKDGVTTACAMLALQAPPPDERQD